jgi:hypothetical protein
MQDDNHDSIEIELIGTTGDVHSDSDVRAAIDLVRWELELLRPG